MQLIANGPDIPDTLIQAHEEGRVVFFCGAGISYSAGLPDFKDLVSAIYRQAGTTPDNLEDIALGRDQFDAVLDLLERRLPGQRLEVRNALVEVLKPRLRRKGAKDNHAALLQLARTRDGMLRLVTTNFDRIFEHVIARSKMDVPTYLAPQLPIPKNSRWNGLVYLHGLLPKHPDPIALNRLVLTSGDFGLAYLVERWAARFVSELFRNYVVCFVGYSINDPVLRYMMDALAADRMQGEDTPQAYAFGDCKLGEEDSKTIEWKAKGVVPILYKVTTARHGHAALTQTLKAWAKTYRDGIHGKECIVAEYAMARPSASTRQDDFVSRMLWALSDESGLPAKRFADFDPVPSLDWLEALSSNSYNHGDLIHFGVPPHKKVDKKLAFSVVHRPASYMQAPWMALVSGGLQDSQWDDLMHQLARWLVRHLDDPELILWLALRGGQLHDHLLRLIEDNLDKFVSLEQEGKTDELERIRAQAPNAIPRPALRVLWRIFLSGRVKSSRRELDLYRWKDRFRREGLTTILRFELRDLLAPKIELKKPFNLFVDDADSDEPKRQKQLVSWELVLATDQPSSSFTDLVGSDDWNIALPILLDDFQKLLIDALDLLRELDEAEDRNDRSFWDLPSIAEHWQNRYSRDWVSLIKFTRDAWLAVYASAPARASSIALKWFSLPYPTFKRLALFAASHDGCVVQDQWVDWLVFGDAWWLWSFDTMRETLRLIVLQGKNLTQSEKNRLEIAILAGPPRVMFRDDIEPEDWKYRVDRLIWLRLAKLNSSGGNLGQKAAEQLEELSMAHPKWQLASDESDEFSHWSCGTGDPGFEDNREIDRVPRKQSEMVVWLNSPTKKHHQSFYESNWRETCRSRFYHCMMALWDLGQEGIWPTEHWREALQVWSEESRIQLSWQYLAPLIQTMPNEDLKDIVQSVSWWIQAASKSISCHEDIFLNLCRLILELPHQDGMEAEQPVTRALNHPVGHITQALLNRWFRSEPNDKDRLPAELEPIFCQLCDTSIAQFLSGRVLLASRLIALFRVDRQWTETHLLPLFDWTCDAHEAQSAWDGFLWSPRLHLPLLIAFREQFLETASHYAELGSHAQQFARFLTYVALDPAETYTEQDFQIAFGKLPQEGLNESAQALVQALEGAGEQREDYWVNRIQPFWQNVWPKSYLLKTESIVENLSQLSIAARGRFPEALSTVLNWLQPLEHPYSVIQMLHESNLPGQFPEDALRLLDAIISDQLWTPKELNLCLEAISHAELSLLQDPRYQRLVEYYRCRRN